MKLMSVSRRVRLAPLALFLTLAGLVHAAPPTSGLDLDGFDKSVSAKKDLFRAANGQWAAKTEIPADKAAYGTVIILRDLSDKRVRAIVDELTAKPQKAGSVEQKVAAFYDSYTDTAGIDKAGLAPLQAMLASIDAIRTRVELAAWLGSAQGQIGTPVKLWVEADSKDPTVNIALTWQSGLGMPDRDYYLKDDERLAKARVAYEVYLTQPASLSGDREAATTAKTVLSLERDIAEAHTGPRSTCATR